MATATTTIDPEVDDIRPVNEIVKARTGKRISPATLWRWRLRGVNGARLECVRCGGVWMTTRAAFADFLARQTANCQPAAEVTAPTERSAAKREKLAAAGLL